MYAYYWPAYTHSVGGQISNGRWRLSSSVVCNTRICNVTHQGAARGEPVMLRPLHVFIHCEWPKRFLLIIKLEEASTQ